MNDLETRMRQAFHDDHGWQSADVLLDGVRRGVGQRRRRRALAAGTVAATGTAYKVTGNQGCQSPCSTIFRHDDSGGWETLATIHGSADSRAYGPVLQLEMAPGGQDGWAWGSGRWSTHDGGKTWTEDTSLSLPSTSDLRGIVDVYPGRSVTWTTVSPHGFLGAGAQLWRTPTGRDEGTRVEPSRGTSGQLRRPPGLAGRADVEG